MKKIILLMMSVLLVFSIFGCSKAEEDTNTKPNVKPNDKGEEKMNDNIHGLQIGWNDSRFLDESIPEFMLPYRIYLPEDYSDDKEYPFLFFIHGNGSRGTDNLSQMNNAKICDTLIRNYKDIIIVAPQCDKGTSWIDADYKNGNYTITPSMTANLESALEIFDYWAETLSTDSKRYYLFGNSAGGFACYDLLARFPDKWACAVPVAGCGDLEQAEKFKDVPIWIHHGTADNLVPYEGSKLMYEKLQSLGAGDKVLFTTYEGEGHTIFNEVGLNNDVAEWIYSQSK